MTKYLGMRVLRGPDWENAEADGGEGHLGTVVGVKAEEGTAEVVWDNGQVTTCRVGKEGKHDLRIYDNAFTGECVSRGVVCQGCRNSSIYGTSWRCSTCSNLDLCSRCYHLGVHPLSHTFLRRDHPTEEGVAVGTRSGASRIPVFGIFPEARVVRGRDWEYGDVDGGPDAGGLVVEVDSPESGSARNAVRVSWDSGQSLQHRLGLHGKVDLVCTEEALGPACYVSHLPVLDVGRFLDVPMEAAGKPAHAEIGLSLAYVPTTTETSQDSNTASAADTDSVRDKNDQDPTSRGATEKVRVGTEGEIQVGDRVMVGVDFETFKDIQSQTASWSENMAKCLERTGVVKSVTSTGEIEVDFEGDALKLNSICLTKVEKASKPLVKPIARKHKVGDTVRILSDLGQLERQQKGHGDWVSDMAKAAGKVGTVMNINVYGNPVVHFGQQYWIFNPDSCIPAPGCATDFIPNQDVHDIPEESKQALHKQIADLWCGDLGKVFGELLGPTLQLPMRISGLFAAVAIGDTHKIACLLEENPQLAQETFMGSTALHYAAMNGQETSVRLLVAKGSDINKGDNEEDTPLHLAIQSRKTALSKAIVELGADVSLTNESGQTPLHTAVAADCPEIVTMLLQHGASVNRRDVHQDTPLFDALNKNDLGSPVVEALMSAKDLDLSVINKDGFNVLHLAALNDRPRLAARVLVLRPSLLTSVEDDGRFTALHVAAANNYTDVIKELVKAGAPVNARCYQERTPLHLACSEDYIDSAIVLVEAGADINAVEMDYKTPLHMCFGPSMDAEETETWEQNSGQQKGVGVARYLIQQGARVDKRNREGKTPLDVAPDAVKDDLRRLALQSQGTKPPARQSTETRVPNPSPASGGTADPAKCVTCHQRVADVIFLPCAHKLVCRQCAGSSNVCSTCGKDVQRKVDIEGNPVMMTQAMTSGTEEVQNAEEQDCKVQ